jgi:hypothetical protein
VDNIFFIRRVQKSVRVHMPVCWLGIDADVLAGVRAGQELFLVFGVDGVGYLRGLENYC